MGACGSSEAEAVQANTAAVDKKAESKEVISSKASRKTLKQSEESKKELKVDINDSNTSDLPEPPKEEVKKKPLTIGLQSTIRKPIAPSKPIMIKNLNKTAQPMVAEQLLIVSEHSTSLSKDEKKESDVSSSSTTTTTSALSSSSSAAAVSSAETKDNTKPAPTATIPTPKAKVKLAPPSKKLNYVSKDDRSFIDAMINRAVVEGESKKVSKSTDGNDSLSLSTSTVPSKNARPSSTLSASTVKNIIPTPAQIIKTRRESDSHNDKGQKVFINVCHSYEIHKMYIQPATIALDKSNNESAVYTCILTTKDYDAVIKTESENILHEMIIKVISKINIQYRDNLINEFIFVKKIQKFIGDTILTSVPSEYLNVTLHNGVHNEINEISTKVEEVAANVKEVMNTNTVVEAQQTIMLGDTDAANGKEVTTTATTARESSYTTDDINVSEYRESLFKQEITAPEFLYHPNAVWADMECRINNKASISFLYLGGGHLLIFTSSSLNSNKKAYKPYGEEFIECMCLFGYNVYDTATHDDADKPVVPADIQQQESRGIKLRITLQQDSTINTSTSNNNVSLPDRYSNQPKSIYITTDGAATYDIWMKCLHEHIQYSDVAAHGKQVKLGNSMAREAYCSRLPDYNFKGLHLTLKTIKFGCFLESHEMIVYGGSVTKLKGFHKDYRDMILIISSKGTEYTRIIYYDPISWTVKGGFNFTKSSKNVISATAGSTDFTITGLSIDDGKSKSLNFRCATPQEADTWRIMITRAHTENLLKLPS